jgi:carboxymethylenebutenolidase
VHAQAEETTEEGTLADDDVCELVSGFDVEISGDAEDEGFSGYFIKALKNNNGAGVLLLSDVYGYESSGIRDFVYRLACVGYNVLIPDLFRGDPWGEMFPPTGEDYENWRKQHTPERIAKDIDVSTAYLKELLEGDEESSSGEPPKYAIVGFCIGGGQTIQTVARQSPTIFAAAVSFYGTRIEPDSLAPSIKVPLLLITGDSDPASPVNVVKEFESRVPGSKAIVYPGRRHAFAHRPDSIEDDEAAEAAFNDMRLWLKSHLLTSGNAPFRGMDK